MKRYDFIIVGSGIAGLYTALQAKDHGSVLIITKGSIDDCNTKHAQGGIAAAISKTDSPELHFRDTVAAGVGLCDEEAVRILVSEAPDRIADLVNYGVPFDTLDGQIALTLEAAHSVPRILHAGGDATGERIEVTLSRRVRESRIQVMENCLASEILLQDGAVRGLRACDCRTGTYIEFACRYLILAAGGVGQLYKFTTNSEVATGDGVALAFSAGAEIADIEFIQFHPTALKLPGVHPFLISEAVRGEGAVLRDVNGYRFMPDYSPAADLAPRDVVARSIVYQMLKTHSDHVLLDATHMPAGVTATRFPQIYRFCLDHGVDITREPVPVAPAAHYMMGGVRTNSWGETSIPGLFAAGENACTGVHGANRLASNSLIEVLVFSKRIMRRISQGASGEARPAAGARTYLLSRRRVPKDLPPVSVAALQHLMWERAGIIRDGVGLAHAASILVGWQRCLPAPADRPSYELHNLVMVGRLVIEAALRRKESRGAHFRFDFPSASSRWKRHIILVNR